MTKILHTADLHIRERDIPEIDRCLQAIVDTAQRETPDLAIVAGDIFDSRDVKVDSQTAIMAIGFVSALMDVCPVAIVIGTPSHDGNAPAILRYARGQFPVVVAEKPMQVALADGEFLMVPCGAISDAILTLIPQPTKQFFQTTAGISEGDREIGQAMSGLFAGFGASAAAYPGVPHILVYHGGISGAKVSTGQTMTGRDIEVSIDQLNMAGADLNLCGHIHMAQQLGDSTFYSGSPWRTNWGEMENKGFFIHSFPKTPMGVFESRFIETPCKRAVRFKENYATPEGLPAELTDQGFLDVSDGPGPGDHEGESILYEISCWQDEAELINKAGIEKRFLDAGAISVGIHITRIPRENVRAEAVLKAETLRDKLVALAQHRGEEVPESVLLKADRLESMTIEELLAFEKGGAA